MINNSFSLKSECQHSHDVAHEYRDEILHKISYIHKKCIYGGVEALCSDLRSINSTIGNNKAYFYESFDDDVINRLLNIFNTSDLTEESFMVFINLFKKLSKYNGEFNSMFFGSQTNYKLEKFDYKKCRREKLIKDYCELIYNLSKTHSAYFNEDFLLGILKYISICDDSSTLLYFLKSITNFLSINIFTTEEQCLNILRIFSSIINNRNSCGNILDSIGKCIDNWIHVNRDIILLIPKTNIINIIIDKINDCDNYNFSNTGFSVLILICSFYKGHLTDMLTQSINLLQIKKSLYNKNTSFHTILFLKHYSSLGDACIVNIINNNIVNITLELFESYENRTKIECVYLWCSILNQCTDDQAEMLELENIYNCCASCFYSLDSALIKTIISMFFCKSQVFRRYINITELNAATESISVDEELHTMLDILDKKLE